ncbi:MAG: helix-turn-helix transcriptional regulator [Pseudomonadota bacterium]
MRHDEIWTGIDRLAAREGLSPSGLAKRAGLDPTAFNPSKRTSKDGRPRWPSTESVARALDAVGAQLDDLATLIGGRPSVQKISSAPLVGFAQAGADGFFDDAGFPKGEGWEEVIFPGLGDEPVYALEITGDSMEPAYRAGDRIVVSPTSPVRTGDRVVARTREGEVMAKVLGKRTESEVELISFNPAYAPRRLPASDVSWIARILWASQ